MPPKKQIQKKEEEDPNAIWGHAQSLEDTRIWEDRKAELIFMRDLFDTRLPLGKEKQDIEEYFNILEEAIDTKDARLTNDKFPDDYGEIDIHGEVSNPPEQYSYFSADLFKQQASKGPTRYIDTNQGSLESKSVPQDLENTDDVDTQQSVSDVSEVDGDIQRLDECSDSDDPDHWARDVQHSSR